MTLAHALKPFLPPVAVEAGRWLLGRTPPRPLPDNGPGLPYLSAADTTAAAARDGLSVRDYVERLYGQEGEVAATLGRIEQSGAFAEPARMLEIGAGTGRYMDEILKRHSPMSYQVYEPARDWSAWLAQAYPSATVQPADGHSLAHTVDGGADLLMAFGVFVYLPFLTAAAYFEEMGRVASPRGWVVFDAMTEACYTEPRLQGLLAAKVRSLNIIPKAWLEAHFAGHGFRLVDNFMRPYSGQVSEMMVYRRD
jgi:hypothetical protein